MYVCCTPTREDQQGTVHEFNFFFFDALYEFYSSHLCVHWHLQSCVFFFHIHRRCCEWMTTKAKQRTHSCSSASSRRLWARRYLFIIFVFFVNYHTLLLSLQSHCFLLVSFFSPILFFVFCCASWTYSFFLVLVLVHISMRLSNVTLHLSRIWLRPAGDM